MVTGCDHEGYEYCWRFPVNPMTRKVIYCEKTAREMFDVIDSHDEWIFHNSAYDLVAFDIIARETGIDKLTLRSIERRKDVHDTMYMAHIHNSMDRNGLKEQGVMYLHLPPDDQELMFKIVQQACGIAKKLGWYVATKTPVHPSLTANTADYHSDYWVPGELYRIGKHKTEDYGWATEKYAIQDVGITMGLNIFYRAHLSKQDWKVYEWHRQCIFPFVRMTSRGFTLNEKNHAEATVRFKRQRAAILQRIRDQVGAPNFNPASSPQMRKYIFGTLKLPVLKRSNAGGPSTDKEVMLAYREAYQSGPAHDFVSNILLERKLKKTDEALTTFHEFKFNGKLFTNIKVPGTKTTRVSSKMPATQNISKNPIEGLEDGDETFILREVFGPPPGYEWYCFDYSQFQIRIFAIAAGDRELIKAFERGEDIHTFVAQRMFRIRTKPDELQRRAAKAVNFGIIFGAGPAKINGMAGYDGAYQLFVKQFPKVHDYLKDCERIARRTGYIRTLGGYPLRVPQKTAYKAANYVIQGTEGEVVKEAIVDIDRYLYRKPRGIWMIMPIHDELDFEAKKGTDHTASLQKIHSLMVKAGEKFGIPSVVDCKRVTSNWANGEDFPI